MKQARWCKAYVGLLGERKLSIGARFTLIALRSFCQAGRSTCFPSNKTLRTFIDCSPRALSRYLAELETKHWIKRRHRRRRDQAFASTFYDLLDERKSMMKEAFPISQKGTTAAIDELPEHKYALAKPLRFKIIK